MFLEESAKREHSIDENQKGPRNLVARSGDGTTRLCPVKDRGESQEYIDQGTAKVWSLLLDQHMTRDIETSFNPFQSLSDPDAGSGSISADQPLSSAETIH